MPVIPATQEAEIRRIMVQNHPWQIVCKILSGKNKQQQTSLTGDSGDFMYLYLR
jgi:hypothetical protein